MKKRNKILSSIISLILTATIAQMPVIQVFANEDVQKQVTLSNWAQEDVGMAYMYELADKGFFKDYQLDVTREELYSVGSAVYGKLTGKSVMPATVNPFKDTENKEVLKAYSIGLLGNTTEEAFEPSKLVTREDVALLVYNVMKVSEPKLDYTTETKTNLGDITLLKEPSLVAIKYVSSKGLLKGKTNSSLDLADKCSREEMLTLFKRAYEFTIQESGRASKGCLWKITGGKSQVYIMGSIHVADMSLYPFSKGIEDAFSKADVLAVEANIQPTNQDIAYMSEKAVFSDGTTIDKKISPETYKTYVETMKKFNIPEVNYTVLKPWYAAMIIPSLNLSQSSISGDMGVDMYLLNRAKNKELVEIEGIKFQVDLFDGFSPELQEAYLKSSLSSTKDTGKAQTQYVDAIKEMLSSWKEGDLSVFEKLVSTTEDDFAKEFNKKLLDGRNGNMSNKIKGFLDDKSEKTYFVVVGAAHYFGDTGILKALKDAGYTVEQILK